MRTLLFDIDGTLLITHGGGKGAMQRAIQEEFGVDRASADISFSGRTDSGIIPELLLLNHLPNDAQHRERLRNRYAAVFPAVLQQCGGKLLPGASELLDRLAQDPRVRVAVMTGNLPETARLKLEHLGLLHHVSWIVGGDLDPLRDDMARRAAEHIRQHHGSAATEDVVVIGDTPDDILCGRAIGAQTVAVCTGRYKREELLTVAPHLIWDDLSDVPTIFDRLVADDLAH